MREATQALLRCISPVMAHRDVSLPRIALVAIGGSGHAAELVGRGGPTRMTHGGHKPARPGA
jgi:dihydroxyacetone kinase